MPPTQTNEVAIVDRFNIVGNNSNNVSIIVNW